MFGRISIVAFILGTSAVGCAPSEPPVADVDVSHVPAVVYTANQGAFTPADEAGSHADTQRLTWLFHLVFHSREASVLNVERVDMSFVQGDETLWQTSYSRAYLERSEWIAGAFADTTEYFMDNIEFVDNHMSAIEIPAGPALPPGEAVSWVRIPLAAPWFADADRVEVTLTLSSATGAGGVARHTVPLVRPDQEVDLRLPFEGTWAVNAGNDFTTGHRRTGLNSLTMYGWDFTRLGPNGLPYRTTGETPADYWGYDEPVYAAGDGIVVDVRNDIAEYGIGETPPRHVIEADTDVFAGNLVTIDHGNGEYSLTCHMRAGTIPVAVGDEVKAGDFIGRVGNSGVSQVPHIHFNLMDGDEWIDAKGVPALFGRFEKIRMGGRPLAFELGNPVTDWLVRPIE